MNIKAAIRNEKTFKTDTLRGKIPLAGETAISLGALSGPPRRLFAAEIEFSTLRYIVISGTTPIAWRGAFEWIIAPRRFMKASEVSWSDYLIVLETLDEMDNDDV